MSLFKRRHQSVPMKRGDRPEEVAQAVVWLLSDEASFTTPHSSMSPAEDEWAPAAERPGSHGPRKRSDLAFESRRAPERLCSLFRLGEQCLEPGRMSNRIEERA